jgi:hypothetical protein
LAATSSRSYSLRERITISSPFGLLVITGMGRSYS